MAPDLFLVNKPEARSPSSSGVFSESKFRATLRRAAKAVGTAALTPALELYFIMTSGRTPLWAKATAVGALAYFILPFDAVPDWLPGVGYGDDIAVMLGALRSLRQYTTKDIQDRAKDAAERLMAKVAGSSCIQAAHGRR
jgi:uncharacterized membrane protein YkvA (DUF1232 family)